MPPALAPSQFFVVTGRAEAELIREQLTELPTSNILDEPERRNTLPAILWAVASMMRAPATAENDACVTIITADHLIGNTPLFRSTLHAAQERAIREPCIITIGIQPSGIAREWIGFGAIHSDSAHTLASLGMHPGRHTGTADLDGFPAFPASGRLPAYPLLRFEEKPSEPRAREMIASGGWFWNAGMFVFRVSTLEMALKQFQPAIHATYLAMVSALGAGHEDEARRLFAQLPKNVQHPLEPTKMVDASIDYAVMVPLSLCPPAEASVRGVVLPGIFPWLDIGSWDALRKVVAPDARGNIIVGTAHAGEGCRNCILVVEAVPPPRPANALVVERLENHVVVLSKEAALMIVPEEKAQRVKDLKAQYDKMKKEQQPSTQPCLVDCGGQVRSQCSVAGRICAVAVQQNLEAILASAEAGSVAAVVRTL